MAGNAATSFEPDVGGTFVPGTFASQGNNLIGNTDGSSGWVGSDLTGTSAQPLDAMLAPLGNYGGPTETMALLAGSPAIGAGIAVTGVTTDQRGEPPAVRQRHPSTSVPSLRARALPSRPSPKQHPADRGLR